MAQTPATAPLLEREAAQTLLTAAWRDARTGHGSLWLICAEAGGGKTRLARETAALGRSLWGAADPLTPPEPFAAVSQAIPGFVAAPSRAESVARAVSAFAEHTGSAPSLLVLDDLHFADAATIAVVVRLAAECAVRPWLILTTLRPGEGPGDLTNTLTELVARGSVRRLDLPPLSREAVGTLVAALRGRAADVDEIERIYADSGGNPWFAEALARGEGALSLTRDRVHLRLRRLDETAPGALAAALALAPATRPLPHAIVADFYGDDGPALRRILTALRDAGVLVEGADGWRFCHELLRRSLLNSMLDVDRRDAHRRLAEVLQFRVPGAESQVNPDQPAAQPQVLGGSRHPTAAEVAMHFAAAEDPRAVDWALRAGHEAKAVEAHTEAIAQFERALAFGPSAEQGRTALGTIAESAFSLGRFADSLAAAEQAIAVPNGEPEARALLHWTAARAASSLGDYVTDQRHLAEAERVLQGQPVIFAAVQVATARVARANLSALPGRAEQAAARALALVQQLDNRADAARAEMEIKRALLGGPLHRGDPAAFRELANLLRFAEAENLHPGHALAAITGLQGGATFELFHAEADDLYARALDGMRRLRFAWEPFVLPYRMLELVQRGRYAEARALAGTFPQPAADSESGAILLLASVLCEARAGSLDRAGVLLAGARHVAVFRQTVTIDLARLEIAVLEQDSDAGEMAWWMYQVGEARQYARVAAVAVIALAHAGREVPPVPGWLVPDSPLRVFWRWADAVHRQDIPLLRDVAAELTALALPYEAALALRDAGDLGESYRALRQLGATAARNDVAARLRAAGRPVPRRTRATVAHDSLTDTERAVGRMVVAGARNGEVAGRLGVSVHTVETHLSHIYQKAGVRGRVALAAWWRERLE